MTESPVPQDGLADKRQVNGLLQEREERCIGGRFKVENLAGAGRSRQDGRGPAFRGESAALELRTMRESTSSPERSRARQRINNPSVFITELL